ncbi:MAG: NAD(P)/FAD-dependent oxidoreductase, partial [Pseudomonadota bacterium]
VCDPDLAPPGQHVLSATVQYSPYKLRSGWSTQQKQRFAEQIFSVLDRYAPDLREQVLATDVLSPADIEHRYGTQGGHWHHGELTLDQFLFVRPVAGAAQYQTPVDGLYFCGAGAHPGGGITGLPGRNAARVIIKGAK